MADFTHEGTYMGTRFHRWVHSTSTEGREGSLSWGRPDDQAMSDFYGLGWPYWAAQANLSHALGREEGAGMDPLPASPGVFQSLPHPPEDAAFQISWVAWEQTWPAKGQKPAALNRRSLSLTGSLQVQLRQLLPLATLLSDRGSTSPEGSPSRCRVPSAAHASPL